MAKTKIKKWTTGSFGQTPPLSEPPVHKKKNAPFPYILNGQTLMLQSTEHGMSASLISQEVHLHQLPGSLVFLSNIHLLASVLNLGQLCSSLIGGGREFEDLESLHLRLGVSNDWDDCLDSIVIIYLHIFYPWSPEVELWVNRWTFSPSPPSPSPPPHRQLLGGSGLQHALLLCNKGCG